jgi:peptidoglycan/xylan/chitin deacetylase (PgdA/CDA1 family)
VFLSTGLTGLSLPDRTLCLTFDDGPGATPGGGSGPRTTQLSEYLTLQGIPATFFMVGKHARLFPQLAATLATGGHASGNHTFHHLDLVALRQSGGDVVREVRSAHPLVAAAGPASQTLFRPPYGSWSGDVADELNADVFTAALHVGPVMWDVDAADWAAWREGRSAESCADDYLAAIEEAGRGIVLMHDSTADSDDLRAGNRTFDMVKLLVPRLRARGYRFVGLNRVPDIAAALDPGARLLVVDGPAPVTVQLGVHGRGLLRADDGSCLVPDDEGVGPLRRQPHVSPVAAVEVVPVDGQRCAFRTRAGHFIGRGAGADGLEATSAGLGPEQLFRCRLPEVPLPEVPAWRGS